MSIPLVSVIIPTYNRAELLKRAVQSVLNQTHAKLEIIIVDDASEDETPDVVRQFGDDRIVYLRHPENLGKNAKGGQAARNTGIQCAHGDFITFLDSDDEYLPDKIAKQLQLFTKPEIGVATCGGYIVERDQTERKECQVPVLEGEVYGNLLKGPSPPILGIMVRKSVLDAIDAFDETIIAYQEWDIVIQLAKEAEFAFLNEKLFVVYSWRKDEPKVWVQGAVGFYQIVKKYEREIVRVCGRDVAIANYKHASIWAYAKSEGDMPLMQKILWSSFLLKPWDVRPLGHIALLMFGPKVYDGVYQKIRKTLYS